MMTYLGYVATVEFDESVGTLGRLHGSGVNCGPYPIATLLRELDSRRRRVEVTGAERHSEASCLEGGGW